MKKIRSMMLFSLVVAVALVTIVAHQAWAGDASADAWSSFMKQLDPSSAAGPAKSPLACQKISVAVAASGDAWDAFMVTVDPGSKAELGKTVACTETAKAAAARQDDEWERFMNFLDPSRLQYVRR